MINRINIWKDKDTEILKKSNDVINNVNELMANNNPSDEWSFVVLGDSQFLINEPWYTEEKHNKLHGMYQWIVDHADEYNIKMVLQLGDITHHTGTSMRVVVPDDEEYERAVTVTNKLYDAGIPYLQTAGNHEYDYVGTPPNGLVGFNKYFPDTKFKDLHYFGGQYEVTRSENVYYVIYVKGQEYLFITLEFEPNNAILAWADGVLTDHPNCIAVFSTHYYLGNNATSHVATFAGGSSGLGRRIWDEFISRHPSIVMTFCGHTQAGTGVLESVRDDDSVCTQFHHDNSTTPERDQIAIYTVKTGTNSIECNMYSASKSGSGWYTDWPYKMTAPLPATIQNVDSEFLKKVTGVTVDLDVRGVLLEILHGQIVTANHTPVGLNKDIDINGTILTISEGLITVEGSTVPGITSSEDVGGATLTIEEGLITSVVSETTGLTGVSNIGGAMVTIVNGHITNVVPAPVVVL